MSKRLRLGLLAGCVVAGLAALPSAASAATCGVGATSGTDPLLDSGGYAFDLSDNSEPAPGNTDEEDPATLYDGGSSTTSTPPGPRSASDTYDGWGALFVGIGGDSSLANQYFPPDNNSCTYWDGNRTVAYPVLQLNGLAVERRIYVPATGLAGARLIDTVINRGRKPVTTALQVGDTKSADNYGDLGSDSGTGVRASSSGDLAFTPADTWIVTSDSTTTNSDLAIASVLGGPGAREQVDFTTLTGDPAEEPEDNLAWRFDGVKVQPGQVLRFVTGSIQAGVSGGSTAAEAALGASLASAYPGSLSTVLPGPNRTELASLANFANPVKCGGRRVTIAGSDVRDVIIGTKRSDVIFAGAGNDKVKGLKGNDRICGAGGRDVLIGGAGKKDVLKGGAGKDRERQ
jgi:Ca2+-binding RTX toxin-like protein